MATFLDRWIDGGATGDASGDSPTNAFTTQAQVNAVAFNLVLADQILRLWNVGSTALTGGLLQSGNWIVDIDHYIMYIGGALGTAWDQSAGSIASSADEGLIVDVDYTKLYNLQVENIKATPDSFDSAIKVDAENVELHNVNARGGRQCLDVTSGVLAVKSNFKNKSGGGAGIILRGGSNVDLRHCNADGDTYGVRLFQGASVVVAENSWASSWFQDGGHTGSKTLTNCASADTSADGTSPVTNVAYDNTNFTEVADAQEDWFPPVGSALRGAGAVLGAPLNATHDMTSNPVALTPVVGIPFQNPPSIGAAAVPVVVSANPGLRIRGFTDAAGTSPVADASGIGIVVKSTYNEDAELLDISTAAWVSGVMTIDNDAVGVVDDVVHVTSPGLFERTYTVIDLDAVPTEYSD